MLIRYLLLATVAFGTLSVFVGNAESKCCKTSYNTCACGYKKCPAGKGSC